MHRVDYDVVIAGGGLAGLLAAKEAASKGLSVAVIEEDFEIGLPDKCDGLVSMKALMCLGVIPTSRAVQNTVRRVLLHPPSGKPIEVETSKQLKVVVLDRGIFDKDLAKAASSKGAEIILGVRVGKAVEEEGFVRVEANRILKSKIYIEARGTSALPGDKQRSLLPAARYDVEAKWIQEDTIEVYVDSTKYPGFFLWVIPKGKDSAKVGVAGRSINCFATLDEFLKQRGGQVIKKVSAPIYVGGPIDNFVKGRMMIVGDSAGQTKPSTGGGIYSCGLAGVLAGQAAAKYLLDGDTDALQKYSRSWLHLFEEDFKTSLQARKVYEKMDNRSIEKVFNLIREKDLLNELLQEDGFDQHSKWIRRILSVEDLVKLFSIVAAEEVRSLIKQIGEFLMHRR